MKKIGVAILGGTGFGAGELMRILIQHPLVDIVSVVSSSESGQAVTKYHPYLQGFYNLDFCSEIDFTTLDQYEHSFCFLALPDSVTGSTVHQILEKSSKTKIIDLSGSYRLQNHNLHNKFYPESILDPELRKNFVYGLPEINKEKIKSARLIANPGCHVTACTLATLPLMKYSITGSLVFDSKTGTSGGGRKLADVFHHPRMSANSAAYKILEHRHEPEISLALGDPLNQKFSTMFVPHLLPVSRGILATAYLTVSENVDTKTLLSEYRSFYKDSPFVRVIDGSPELRNVVGSNFCDVTVKARGKQIVAIAAQDNLIKGMTGQAVQNMNLMAEIDEKTGLQFAALGLI